MANLDRIVSVQISLNTTAIKEQSFSDLLILGAHSLAPGRVAVITEADQLLDMGMLPTDPLYLAAQDVFSQIPSIVRLYIGRQQVDAQSFTVGAAVDGAEYALDVSWRDNTGSTVTAHAAVTADGTDTPTTIAADLVTAINATAAPVTAANVAGVVTLTTDVAGVPFGVYGLTGNLTRSVSVTAETPAEALAAVKAENNDWYGVSITQRDEASIMSAAEWVEANRKLLGVSVGGTGPLDPGVTNDIGSKLMQAQYFRTHWWYHAALSTEWLEAAIASHAFTFYPGGETWANKRLAGITYDNLPEGASIAVAAKNGNTFEPFRNFAITQYGRVAAGEWIDVIRFRDWLAEQVQINVTSALINARGKVPYTDPGIQIIVTAIRQALDLGVRRGGIAPPEEDPDNDTRMIPSYTIDAPRSGSIPFNDKANRVLRDLNFTARLAGAIHTVEIKGSLTYAL